MTVEGFLGGRVTLHVGDCLDVLAEMPENSVDSVVCDPPYHLTSIVKRFGGEGAAPAKAKESGAFQRASAGFMGKAWDGGDIAFRVETWAAVLRVLKPGGYILAFASSRGFGRMSVAIEDAGFITHPMIGWIFGSGFPKATRIKAEGFDGQRYGGQALKPALEPIYMGQKPFSEDTGTANILRWGTGAVNIGACRIHSDDAKGRGYTVKRTAPGATQNATGRTKFDDVTFTGRTQDGRWPANLIHDGSEVVETAFPETPGQQAAVTGKEPGAEHTFILDRLGGDHAPRHPRGDSGTATRFFYAAKADAEDRAGSRHPTVKPLDLIQYLCRLITPKGGTILDSFAGTGTTGEAAWREGFNAILIEREPEYAEDIRRRMKLVLAGADERRRVLASVDAGRSEAAPDHGPLFGGGA
jgi:site-specific DNA-methyltransferase (adenine-specific)